MMQVISEDLSRHFRLLSLMSVIMVVYIHATTLKYAPMLPWNSSVGHLQSYLSHNLFHVALPIFFINAAFFLFLGRDITFSTLFGRQKRRIIGLVLPYLAWAVLWYVLVKAYEVMTGTIPVSIEGGVLESLILSPIPGQMWFLRDLILLVALSPFFLIIPKQLLVSLTIITLFWWLWDQTPVVLTERKYWYQILSNEALTWFLIGGLLARVIGGNVLSTFLSHRHPKIFVLALLGWGVLPIIPLPGELSHGLSVVSGTLSLGLSLPWLTRMARSEWVGLLSSYIFLIYLGHHPALSFLIAPIIVWANGNVLVHTMVYLIAPCFIVVGIVVVFDLVQRFAPWIVFVLNGGRKIHPVVSRGIDGS